MCLARGKRLNNQNTSPLTASAIPWQLLQLPWVIILPHDSWHSVDLLGKKTALRERCSNELKTSATCHSHLFDEPICSVFEILDQALVPYSLLILDGCDLNHIRLLRPGQQRNSEPRFGGGEPPRTCCFEQVGTSDFFICAYFHFHHFFIKFSCIFP